MDLTLQSIRINISGGKMYYNTQQSNGRWILNFVVAETIQYTIINEYTAYHVRMERENDIVELVQSSSSLTISDSRISNLSVRRLIASESASCSSKDKGCRIEKTSNLLQKKY